MQPLAVLFFGPQGAGKGTQVQLLINYLRDKNPNRGIIHMDMGQMLRDIAGSENYISNVIRKEQAQGVMVPDFLPVYLMTKTLIEHFTGDQHIIADGVSRRPGQTHAFDDMMVFAGHSQYQIIDLQLSEEESVKRLMKRGRSDDTEEAIKRRLAWHRTEVEPLLEMLKGRGRITHHVDGNRSIEEVHADILHRLSIS